MTVHGDVFKVKFAHDGSVVARHRSRLYIYTPLYPCVCEKSLEILENLLKSWAIKIGTYIYCFSGEEI